MFTKVMKKIKEVAAKRKNTIITTMAAFAYAYMTRPVVVFAGPSSYTAPLDNLKTVLITIAGSAGVIIVLYGIFRFALAFKKMDQNGEHDAIFTMIAGGILLAASVVLTALGV